MLHKLVNYRITILKLRLSLLHYVDKYDNLLGLVPARHMWYVPKMQRGVRFVHVVSFIMAAAIH